MAIQVKTNFGNTVKLPTTYEVNSRIAEVIRDGGSGQILIRLFDTEQDAMLYSLTYPNVLCIFG